MPVKIIKGNIFTSKCQTIVNTVNCVGVMGAGIALEYRLRYPEMFEKYVQYCTSKSIDIGKLWIFNADDGRRILNFPTKKDWKHPSKIEYLQLGLEKFVSTYQEKGITSIAFPLLGADKGKIPVSISMNLMIQYLEPLDITVEIYEYDRFAKDDLFESIKSWLTSQSIDSISKQTGISPSLTHKVLESINNPEARQLNQIAKTKGIGIKTVEKIYKVSRSLDNIRPQGSLI